MLPSINQRINLYDGASQEKGEVHRQGGAGGQEKGEVRRQGGAGHEAGGEQGERSQDISSQRPGGQSAQEGIQEPAGVAGGRPPRVHWPAQPLRGGSHREQVGQQLQSGAVGSGRVHPAVQGTPAAGREAIGAAGGAQGQGTRVLVRPRELSRTRVGRAGGGTSLMMVSNELQDEKIGYTVDRKQVQPMAQKNQTALQKMQEIAGRLISNTPELAKMLDTDSALRPKKPSSPSGKKGKGVALAGLGVSRGEMTANDYHERCKELGAEVGLWKEKCVGLEEEIGIVKQRFVEREIQYRGIIEELQDEIKSKSCLDSSDRNRMAGISDLHRQIQDNIGTIQNKTSKILIEQESDIRRFFNKKINEIKEKFKEDKINKNEKDQEYQQKEKQMASELEWIKNIAHKIDDENKTLMRKYSALRSEVDIQEKDKDLLLRELLLKKKENAALRTQVEQYEKLLNEVSKEMEDDPKQELELSRASRPDASSKLQSQKTEAALDSRRADNAIAHLNRVITKERNRVRELKNLYMREMGGKSELEKIVRGLVEDVRESIIEVEKDKNHPRRKTTELSGEAREQLLSTLLSNEKILTLIYDKTFYSGVNRPAHDMELPSDLRQILEDKEAEGFD